LAHPDRWLELADPSMENQVRVSEEAIRTTKVANGQTLAQAARDGRLVEKQSVLCHSCGATAELHRVFHRHYYGIVTAVGVWITFPFVVAFRWGLAVHMAVTFITAALVVGTYAAIRHLKYQWTRPETCSVCGGGLFLPPVTQLGRKYPCPDCGSRDYHYDDTERPSPPKAK